MWKRAEIHNQFVPVRRHSIPLQNEWDFFRFFATLFHIQKVNNVDNESFFNEHNAYNVHEYTHLPEQETQKFNSLSLCFELVHICDFNVTLVWVEICWFSLSLSLAPCKVDSLQFHRLTSPNQSNLIHFITFATISVPFVGLSNLNILFVETYCEWVHCIRFNATIWSFESMQNTFDSFPYKPKEIQKNETFSLISFLLDGIFCDTIRLLYIHFGWFGVCALHSVHFSMDYGKIEFWTFICTANKNYDLWNTSDCD